MPHRANAAGIWPAGRPSLRLTAMQSPPRRWTRWPIIALAICLAAGVFVRWVRLGHMSLWLDEGYTVWVMSLSIPEMTRVLRHDVGSPLLYVLMGGWSAIFGTSEFALRSFSAMCGTLALGAMVPLADRILRRPWAVVAAVGWFAISYMLVFYAREARYYALMTLVGVLSLDLMDRHLRRPNGWFLAGLAAANIVGLYTHNLMGVYLAALDVAWLVWPGVQSTRRRLRDLLIVNGVVAAAFSPWIPVVIDQMRWMGAHFWAQRPDGWTLAIAVGTLLGPVFWHTSSFMHQLGLHPLAGMHRATQFTLGLGFALIFAGTFLHWREGRRRARPMATGIEEDVAPPGSGWRIPTGLMVYAFLPVIVIFIKSVIGKPMFYERLFIASGPPIAMLLAMPLAKARTKVGMAAAAIGMAMLLRLTAFSTDNGLRYYVMEDWRSAYQYLAGRPTTGRRLLVFVATEGQLPFDYYAQRDPAGRLTGPNVDRTGLPGGFFDIDPPQNVRRVLSFDDTKPLAQAMASGKYDEIDLVLTHMGYSDPMGYSITAIDRGWRWMDSWLSDEQRVEIHRYRPTDGK